MLKHQIGTRKGSKIPIFRKVSWFRNFRSRLVAQILNLSSSRAQGAGAESLGHAHPTVMLPAPPLPNEEAAGGYPRNNTPSAARPSHIKPKSQTEEGVCS
eukprot:3227997-Amphidinium_carterae.1